jgi:hypothetical protein
VEGQKCYLLGDEFAIANSDCQTAPGDAEGRP